MLASSPVVHGKICQQPTDRRGFPPGTASFPPTIMPALGNIRENGIIHQSNKHINELSDNLRRVLYQRSCFDKPESTTIIEQNTLATLVLKLISQTRITLHPHSLVNNFGV